MTGTGAIISAVHLVFKFASKYDGWVRHNRNLKPRIVGDTHFMLKNKKNANLNCFLKRKLSNIIRNIRVYLVIEINHIWSYIVVKFYFWKITIETENDQFFEMDFIAESNLQFYTIGKWDYQKFFLHTENFINYWCLQQVLPPN